MKKIYLITHSFPWGKDEKTFILPELEKMVSTYDVTIISCAGKTEKDDIANLTELDKRITVLHYMVPIMTFSQKITKSLKALFLPEFWEECFDIVKERKFILCRLTESLAFFSYAELFKTWFLNNCKIEYEQETILYTFWYNEITLAFTNIVRKKRNVKLITRTHGCDLYNERFIGVRQPFKKSMNKWLDCIVFASEDGYKYYKKTFLNKGENTRCEICKLGVAANNKMTCSSSDGIFRLVSCSHIIPLKRLELIIDGLSVIEGVSIEWVHFGDGELMEAINHYAIEKLGSLNNISYEFKGYQPNACIIKYYNENPVDCFITTSQTEGGCPLSIQEAMSCGIPIIGTSVGDIPKMIKENGYVLSSEPSKEEVAEKIIKMCQLSQIDKDIMKQQSINIWKKEYNSQINSNKMLEILKSL